MLAKRIIIIIILMINLKVPEMMILYFEYFYFFINQIIIMKLTQEIKFSLQKTQKAISI